MYRPDPQIQSRLKREKTKWDSPRTKKRQRSIDTKKRGVFVKKKGKDIRKTAGSSKKRKRSKIPWPQKTGRKGHGRGEVLLPLRERGPAKTAKKRKRNYVEKRFTIITKKCSERKGDPLNLQSRPRRTLETEESTFRRPGEKSRSEEGEEREVCSLILIKEGLPSDEGSSKRGRKGETRR